MKNWLCIVLVTGLVGVVQAAPEVDPAKAFQQGNWAEAAEGYDQVTQEQPQNATAWFRLGYALHALGRYEEALPAHARAAALQHPGQATAAYNAACASAQLRRVDEAVQWLKKSVAAGFKNEALIAQDTDLAVLRDDPRVAALRRSLLNAGRFKSLLPETAGDARQFDFWLGEWESQNFSPDGSGGWRPSTGLVTRVFSAADGHAIVEYSAPPRIAANGGTGGYLGFSLRVYDEARQAWILLLNWPSKSQPLFYALSGRFHHGRGEFVTARGPGPGGTVKQTRFTFSDITEDSYRWDSASTTDGGKSWATTLVFEAKRRAGPAALGLGPAKTNAHAPEAVFRAFDFLLGTWRGEREIRQPDGSTVQRPVARTSYAILEGGAVVDHVEVGTGDEALRSYAVRAYEPARKAWVQYRVDNRVARMERFQGQVKDAAIELVGAAGPGSAGAEGKLVWTERGPDVVRCERHGQGGWVWRETLRRAK